MVAHVYVNVGGHNKMWAFASSPTLCRV
jgi:hypothetical protein